LIKGGKNLIFYSRKQNKCVSRGFSLVELLFAMLIFTTSLLLIFNLFPTAYKSSAQSRHVLISTEIGRKEMERLKSLSWYNLDMKMEGGRQKTTTLVTTTDGRSIATEYVVSPMITAFQKDPVTGEVVIKSVRIQVKYGDETSQRIGAVLDTLIKKP
jgi:prepilin-type N-terminal cleavage/methylation domain-containing protein